MSASLHARHRAASRSSRGSSKGRLATLAEVAMPRAASQRDFEPCAATASMFLYAQGNSVVCSHHDTLSIERCFSRHSEEIQLLEVDNISDKGAGRLVVSYDAGQTAIVWDCMTGDEIARFASYENLTVAAWMRNGNLAFGNAQGNIILFEPTTSEHISTRTIDQIPISALAPAADCRTYAIGFSNGSLLIAILQPKFIILHNLTTSTGPSPIVTLSWHTSSSRQKADMLATQTNDGDLRVWSISKSPHSADSAKVVRILRRTENSQRGPNWLGWSKNGRIIQFSEGETSSWDVRTKNVTYESVPTLDNVRGLAVYGPGATLFTMGSNNTLQQFDLNSPATMVANVNHANLLPPSPPISIEEQKKKNASTHTSRAEMTSVPINIDISESDEDHMSPLARMAREMDRLEQGRNDLEHAETSSAASSRSRTSTVSRSSVESGPRYRKHTSVVSRGMSEGTTMSLGSSLHSPREPSISIRDSISLASASTRSTRSRPRGSRLRQEVLPSPEDAKVADLFKFTKSRLSDIPYLHPKVMDNAHLTNNDLRRQMLSTIFGWEGEADELIRDEINRQPQGSLVRLLLAKWLGDIDTDIMASNSESMTSSDWMLLALSGIGGHASQAKVARAYVQRLLEKGDVHTAATIMIGMGDRNDAIEIYVSHKRYMEALILTALVFPADWQRQSELVRKWGEWAVQHSQQQLAVRCFSCLGVESSEPWASPTAQALTFAQFPHHTIPEILSPPLSPPGPRGPQRSIAKTSALKLITSFGDANAKSKFFSVDNERTPLGGPGTPIAESALSPQGSATARTAFIKPGHRSAYNTPVSTRTATPGGFHRQRLPSIGEMPSDGIPQLTTNSRALPTPTDSERGPVSSVGSHELKSSDIMQLSSATYNPLPPRPATTSPMMERNKMRIPNSLPSPTPGSFSVIKREARARNGSRDRKPEGLHIQRIESVMTRDYMTSPELSTTSSVARSVTSHSVAGSIASISTTATSRSRTHYDRAYRGQGASPVVTGGPLNQYISSLESAQYHAEKQQSRRSSRERRDKSGRGRSSSRKPKTRESSEDRGRSAVHYIKPAKRSPTSPIPMSPEDLRDLGAVGYDDEATGTETKRARGTSRSRIRASSRARHSSTESASRARVGTKPPSRVASRNTSRRRSPDTRVTIVTARGRSKGREGSVMRSPSSPLPMSPEARLYQDDAPDYADLSRSNDEPKGGQRSRSHGRERGLSIARDGSPELKRRGRSSSRKPGERDVSRTRKEPSSHQNRERREPSLPRLVDQRAGDLNQIKDARTLKKEQAARELEERRKSLALRPSVPPIVHPEELARLSPMQYRSNGTAQEILRPSQFSPPFRFQSPPPRSQTSSPSALQTQNVPPVSVGLPATPQAMRHPKYDPDNNDIPEVPQIPQKYDLGQQIAWGSLNSITQDNYLDTLGPLPQTTYQAAPRRVPPRSASAPIPDYPLLSPPPIPATLPTHPAFHAALPPSSRRRTQDSNASRNPGVQPTRKITAVDSQPGTLGYESRSNSPAYSSSSQGIMSGIDETMETNYANEPPSPPPPMLKELQHLAIPPPPPPPPIAPMYRPGSQSSNFIASGGTQGSGVIEIVMDDDENTNASNSIIGVQAPTLHQSALNPSSGHNRANSENESGIQGRFSRAAERLRSASRGRNGSSHMDRKSPPQEPSAYESLPGMRHSNRSPTSPGGISSGGNIERHPREVKAAMQAMEGYI